jgi:hypothetical protein
MWTVWTAREHSHNKLHNPNPIGIRMDCERIDRPTRNLLLRSRLASSGFGGNSLLKGAVVFGSRMDCILGEMV